MDTKRLAVTWLAAGSLALAAGCSGENEASNGANLETSEMHLTMDVGAASGVTGMHFEIVPVNCTDGAPLEGKSPIVADKALSELGVPGSIPGLEDNPLDKASTHAFADHFVTLPAGCYDVSTTPKSAALTCYPAHKLGVQVEEGKTTEVLLINQCLGTDPGALDTLSTVNHTPTLLDVSFPKAKFVGTCAPQVVCATATDSDGDPIEFVFTQTGGPAVAGPAVVSKTNNADGSTTQCVRYVAQAEGRVGLTVTVYDMLHDGGAFQRIEAWLAAHGDAHPSHATLDLPFYAVLDRLPAAEVCGDGIDNDCNDIIDDPSACRPPCTPPLKPVCEGAPIDLMILEDLSGSFYDDVATVKANAASLVSALKFANPGVAFGLASFIDKPFYPFGSAGDYVFVQNQALTSDDAAFITAVNALATRDGADYSEAQIEALGLLSVNAASAGFRSGASHFVVLATDATFHVAGECTLATGGCTSGNNGDGVADLKEDYPSQDQVIAELNAANITPVFAIAGGAFVEAPYRALIEKLGRGSVVGLSGDSANLIDAIFSGIPDCVCR